VISVEEIVVTRRSLCGTFLGASWTAGQSLAWDCQQQRERSCTSSNVTITFLAVKCKFGCFLAALSRGAQHSMVKVHCLPTCSQRARYTYASLVGTCPVVISLGANASLCHAVQDTHCAPLMAHNCLTPHSVLLLFVVYVCLAIRRVIAKQE